ncbi:MAG TPA: hypothetical protein PK733_13530 [Clostridiales bacterium]|nr:hypothetical protein [Clostridiales bacterium]
MICKYEDLGEFDSGIVLTGGGISYVNGNRQIAGEVFGLPVRVASYRNYAGISKPEFAAAAGIIKYVSSRNKRASIVYNVKDKQVETEHKKDGIFNRIIKVLERWFF